MKKHFYDKCDGGICLKCDCCTHPSCCPQNEECNGHNWDFLSRLPTLDSGPRNHIDILGEWKMALGERDEVV